jgi:hypothetical protein
MVVPFLVLFWKKFQVSGGIDAKLLAGYGDLELNNFDKAFKYV